MKKIQRTHQKTERQDGVSLESDVVGCNGNYTDKQTDPASCSKDCEVRNKQSHFVCCLWLSDPLTLWRLLSLKQKWCQWKLPLFDPREAQTLVELPAVDSLRMVTRSDVHLVFEEPWVPPPAPKKIKKSKKKIRRLIGEGNKTANSKDSKVLSLVFTKWYF